MERFEVGGVGWEGAEGRGGGDGEVAEVSWGKGGGRVVLWVGVRCGRSGELGLGLG